MLITVLWQKTLKDVNEGSLFLEAWVSQQTKVLLNHGKLVGLLGGDHSIALGFLKVLAEREGNFGILHIDAHCDLRKAYLDFKYSHASIMYNVFGRNSRSEKISAGWNKRIIAKKKKNT